MQQASTELVKHAFLLLPACQVRRAAAAQAARAHASLQQQGSTPVACHVLWHHPTALSSAQAASLVLLCQEGIRKVGRLCDEGAALRLHALKEAQPTSLPELAAAQEAAQARCLAALQDVLERAGDAVAAACNLALAALEATMLEFRTKQVCAWPAGPSMLMLACWLGELNSYEHSSYTAAPTAWLSPTQSSAAVANQ